MISGNKKNEQKTCWYYRISVDFIGICFLFLWFYKLKNNVDVPELDNTKEQQFAHRNMLCQTRYAQISPERNEQFC